MNSLSGWACTLGCPHGACLCVCARPLEVFLVGCAPESALQTRLDDDHEVCFTAMPRASLEGPVHLEWARNAEAAPAETPHLPPTPCKYFPHTHAVRMQLQGLRPLISCSGTCSTYDVCRHAVQTTGSFVLRRSVDGRSNGSPLPSWVPPPPVSEQATPTGSRTFSHAGSGSGASSPHSAAQSPAAGSAAGSPLGQPPRQPFAAGGSQLNPAFGAVAAASDAESASAVAARRLHCGSIRMGYAAVK